MTDYGEISAIPCRHCKSIATREHCLNFRACHWIVCLDCRRISVVKLSAA